MLLEPAWAHISLVHSDPVLRSLCLCMCCLQAGTAEPSGQNAADAAGAGSAASQGPQQMVGMDGPGATEPSASGRAADNTGTAPQSSGEQGGAAPGSQAATQGSHAPVPFAMVDEVSEGSPAESAGVRVGDQVCAFGEVVGVASGSGSQLLPRVAQVLAGSEGTAVRMLVLRAGTPVILSLTPRRWEGRGLLGCHLRPL